jgi:DNA polymerase I-like protein with 3'-5' exonuclease and polymerase domains
MRLVFDVETDGLLRGLSVIHCLVTHDLDTNEVRKYDDSGSRETITTGLNYLAEADELWGHNIVGYDFEAIKEVYPFFEPKGRVYDTLILSRLLFTDMLDRDFRSRPANMPGNLYGRHSLESWGYRLGVLKSEYGKQLDGDWHVYTPEMLEYCAQDVEVSVALAKLFEPKLEEYAQAIETEHKLAALMSWQEREGFPFNIRKAQKLEGVLRKELEAISDEMKSTFTFVDGGPFIPARDNKTKGYIKGVEFNKLKDFNPTSRDHIAWAFMTHRGWEPKEMTDTGRPRIDADVLREIGTDEALKFARILELQKHLGQLSEGQNAWLKRVEDDGRIHHSCILNTNTGRMAHLKPNLAQVPTGHEYRELFNAGEGRVLVSADAAGLELRCLAHYLARYDGGKFAKEVVEGDIHQAMADVSGVDRKTQKGVTYCLIYGGGDYKLGLTAGSSKQQATKRGKELRERLLKGIDGFADLVAAVQQRAKSGVLRAIDGRPIRLQGKNHAALNYLLQSCGAVLCKAWVLRANELAKEAGIDYWPVEFVHDQQSWSVNPEDEEKALSCITAAIKDVERQFSFRCELECDPKSGHTWAEVH